MHQADASAASSWRVPSNHSGKFLPPASRGNRRASAPRPGGRSVLRCAAISASLCGSCNRFVKNFRKSFAAQCRLLRQCLRRRRPRSAARIERLVVVERIRIGHQQRRPADHREFRHGRGAGAADDEMRVGDAPCHVGEERRHLGLRRRARHRPPSRAPRPPARACCTSRSSARFSGGSSAIACGRACEKNCAPWLPPKTSRLNGSSACRTG